ncbi:MAG: hypothetical protein GKR90_20010 [Pseudomonadales bacterium]|nr:hypothetical protein [Pseudomonadales bacterium]
MHDVEKLKVLPNFLAKLAARFSSKLLTKLAIVGSVVMLSSAFSAPAEAGPHYRGYHGGDYYNRHSYRHGYRHGYRRHHRRHRSDRGAYLVGGLVLGGIIASAIHRNQDHHVYRDTREIRETRVVRTPRSDDRVSRHLYRDRNGNCFERTSSPNGDELLAELDPASCAW